MGYGKIIVGRPQGANRASVCSYQGRIVVTKPDDTPTIDGKTISNFKASGSSRLRTAYIDLEYGTFSRLPLSAIESSFAARDIGPISGYLTKGGECSTRGTFFEGTYYASEGTYVKGAEDVDCAPLHVNDYSNSFITDFDVVGFADIDDGKDKFSPSGMPIPGTGRPNIYPVVKFKQFELLQEGWSSKGIRGSYYLSDVLWSFAFPYPNGNRSAQFYDGLSGVVRRFTWGNGNCWLTGRRCLLKNDVNGGTHIGMVIPYFRPHVFNRGGVAMTIPASEVHGSFGIMSGYISFSEIS